MFVVTALVLIGALGLGQVVRSLREQPAAASGESRHPSGLIVLGPADVTNLHPLNEGLAKALSDAQELAKKNPDLFGYPYADRVTGELVLTPVTSEAEALARQWTPLGAQALAVRRRTEVVDRSYARLEAIRRDAIGAGTAGLPDNDAIQATTQDDEHNRVLIIMNRLSDPLLFALAARYGTEAIEVRVDPRFGPFESIAGRGASEAMSVGAVAVAAGVAIAALIFLLLNWRRGKQTSST
jgi:hypothetical protein